MRLDASVRTKYVLDLFSRTCKASSVLVWSFSEGHMGHFSFLVKDPHKGYLGSQLWLPKSQVRVISIKSSLEFEVRGDNGMEFLQLWQEGPHHLAVPREYILHRDYATLSFPIVDMTPTHFPRASFKSNLVLDFKEPGKRTQRDAFAVFAEQDNGLLHLACGHGKTCLALHKIAHEGLNTLIIVNQTTILSQWESAIKKFLAFDGSIGLIQGAPSSWDWQHPVTIAMLHSLARYSDQVTPAMRRWFGMVLWDECFVAGTLVDGVPIEQKQVGDLVWSFDELTGTFSEQPIERIFISTPHALVSVFVDEVEIVCTPGHPFWTQRGWVPACLLTDNDVLLTQEARPKERALSSWKRVGGVEVLQPGRGGTFGGRCPNGLVYNFQVKNTPTYGVSPLGVVVHNCHHLSAPYFCITATMFPGKRFGLTATAIREDGTEVIYNYHLGEVFYKDLMQTVKPTIVFRQTPFVIPAEDYRANVIDKRGNPNISKLRSYVGTEMLDRNLYLMRDIQNALAAGRKILVLSHSKQQLKLLHKSFLDNAVDCGICTGDQNVAQRWQALRDKQLIFGTHQLVMEAIDEDSLDTLYWLTPFGSQHPEGGKNALQQGMGRIQGYRYQPGMKQPLVVIFDDIYIKHFHRMCNKLRQQLRRWPEDEGGPYPYSTVKPYEEKT